MLYLPIKNSWVLSRAAQRVYFACATANLYLLAVWIGTRMALDASRAASLAVSTSAVLIVRILLWPGILGTALLTVGMWYFWFTFDQSNWIKRALWFFVLFLGFALGPLLYYFLTYRRNAALQR